MTEKISKVDENNLCTGCGTCYSSCPQESIKMIINNDKGVYIPEVNENKCVWCSMCSKVCPGHEFDFKQFNTDIFGKQPQNALAGNYLNCYLGFSTDKDIRYNSSSGGLISHILIYLLENKLIDGALVTKMNDKKPLQPEPFIARTKKEILNASKSKYCPVPANVALKEILKSDGGKYAVVGLPCQINGIRKAGKMFKDLNQKIVLYLGIFCGHAPTFHATEIFLKRAGIDVGHVTSLSYRGRGWPGKVKIHSQNTTTSFDFPEYWKFAGSNFFIPSCCLMCVDALCEFSDISLGDAWLPEVNKDPIGTSLIIVRSENGQNLINKMKTDKELNLKEIDIEKVLLSQLYMLYFKKMNFNTLKRLFEQTPTFIKDDGIKTSILDELIMLFVYMNSYVGSKSAFRTLLSTMPSKLLVTYMLHYNFIYYIIYRKFMKTIKGS